MIVDRLVNGLRADLGGFWGQVSPPQLPPLGLHTFRVTPPGGTVRLHLRVEADGHGLLFVDVTDVVHLNPSATYIAWLALNGLPRERAAGALVARFGARLPIAVDQIYTMVERFSNPTLGCPTCAVLPGNAALPRTSGAEVLPGPAVLAQTALFSTTVHAPFKADLAITYGCNNHCSHCYNEPDRLDMASLTAPEWKRVIDVLHRVGVPHLIFTGGEATLHPDLPELIAYADGLGHICGLNTNGRRIAHRPFMQTLADAGLNHIQVTLSSSRPALHDDINGATAWKQTVRGIENAMACGVHAITNTTLMQRNRDHVEEIIDFLYGLGIRTFAMNGMIYSGGGYGDAGASPDAIPEAEMAPLLIRVRDHAADLGMRFLWYTPTEYCRLSPVELEIGAKRCNAGEYSMCIEPNGDVLPCQSFYVAAGNVLRDPWESIWDSSLFRSFRDREDNPRLAGLPEKCWECPDLPLCGGGCRIEREARDGVHTATAGGGAAVGRCSCATSATVPTACGGGAGACHSDAIGSGFKPNASLTRREPRGGLISADSLFAEFDKA